jgi:hypothetical protein
MSGQLEAALRLKKRRVELTEDSKDLSSPMVRITEDLDGAMRMLRASKEANSVNVLEERASE